MRIHKTNLLVAGLTAAVTILFAVTAAWQWWTVPLSFALGCAASGAAFWLILGLVSLTVRMDKHYDSPSRFYAELFIPQERRASTPLRYRRGD